MRLALFVAAALAVTAPFQCASDPDPDRAMEDSAPRALWDLSVRFEAEGNEQARRTTLEQLVERYPSSRYAQRAQVVLEDEPTTAEPTPGDTTDDAQGGPTDQP